MMFAFCQETPALSSTASTLPPTDPRAAAATAPPLEDVRVVIVEDDEDVRAAITFLLEADGYHVRSVGTGTGALALVQAFRPQCVLVDLNLPGLDGAQVTRQLRERVGSALVIIAVTAISLPSAHDRLEAAGVDFILVKPVDGDVLRRFLPPLTHATSFPRP